LVIGIFIAGIQIYSTARISSMGKEQGKIKTQIDNLLDLESIAQAQAKGKSSVEFNYQKRKDNSERLTDFSFKICKLTALLYEEHTKKMIRMTEQVESWHKEGVNNYISPYEQSHISESKQMLDEVNLIFILYLKEYGAENFNKHFYLLIMTCQCREILDKTTQSELTESIKQQISGIEGENKLQPTTVMINHINQSKSQSAKLESLQIDLIKSFEELANKIHQNTK